MALTNELIHDTHRLAFETSPDAIVLLEEDGSVAMANLAARELSVHDAIVEHWKGDSEWIAFRTELHARGRAVIELRLDEQIFEIAARRFGARSLLFLRDVTAARRSEDEVARLWGLASMGAFAASFVHDFGNLVTPLTALGSALAREVGADGAGAMFVNELRRTTEAATELVKGVRSFLRGRPSRPRAHDVHQLLLNLQPLIERMVGVATEVEFLLDEEAGEVVVDPVWFERGVLNLVANARDAMPDGGKLTIRSYSMYDDRDSYVAVSVTDDGRGMSAAEQARVFEHSEGLGLWVVQRFVRDAGGRIETLSEVGEGTRVTMYLPRVGHRRRVSTSMRTLSSIIGNATSGGSGRSETLQYVTRITQSG
jgi:two-component system, cell cycle sensor histidine kinase and response regulator CckA